MKNRSPLKRRLSYPRTMGSLSGLLCAAGVKPGVLTLKKHGTRPPPKRHIFMVDDDESVRRALSFLLDAYGFEVQAFASAAEFLGRARTHAPGCLILDVHMAGMDGFALQEKLNADGFRLPIIFISADKRLKFSEPYLKERGAVGFLQKPFDDGELVDLIDRAFEEQGGAPSGFGRAR
jgi:FixJ family two-component response regulator